MGQCMTDSQRRTAGAGALQRLDGLAVDRQGEGALPHTWIATNQQRRRTSARPLSMDTDKCADCQPCRMRMRIALNSICDLVFAASGVGKSCLLKSFMGDPFKVGLSNTIALSVASVCLVRVGATLPHQCRPPQRRASHSRSLRPFTSCQRHESLAIAPLGRPSC